MASEMSMVERVARALAADMEGRFPHRTQLAWDELGVEVKTIMFRRARAALEAMREPTEAMCQAPDEDHPLGARWTWHSMIDAALKD